MADEYKSFYKKVNGNEGTKCHYPTRLDTYGKGCLHNCDFCYARSLLYFRKLWNPNDVAVADIDKIRRRINLIHTKEGIVPAIRMGGMTDCFSEDERKYGVSYETIKAFNEVRQPYLIVTKGTILAEDKYLDVLDKDLAHIQISLTCTSDDLYRKLNYEKAPLPSERIKAIETLYRNGFDVSVRLSPFVPEFIDFDVLSQIDCDKILVEFLRVNSWIEKWFSPHVDLSPYVVKEHGYRHLPLEKKKELISQIRGFSQVSVCEDEDGAYEYWKNNLNPNPEDCCNLRKN